MSIVMTEAEMDIIQQLFHHPAGEEAKLLIERKFCNTQCFDADPYQHAFNAGQRGLALLLCAAAEAKVEVVGTDHLDPNDIDNQLE